MSSKPPAIVAERLTKRYALGMHPLRRLFGGPRECWTAVDDVSFTVARGESVGIVGRNGSGKSTLLKLVCGITKPSVGHLTVRGRIASILELGAGFHPELTGVENVHMLGAIQGLTPGQIGASLDDVLAFADIGAFANEPVKTYSSGMFVRLAFAAAIAHRPEILVVDEALAVGDVAFQAKCMNRMQRMLDDGTTMLFVSHNMYQVRRMCQRALYLKQGRLEQIGAAGTVCDAYERNLPSEIELDEVTALASPAFRFEMITLESPGTAAPSRVFTTEESLPFTVSITYTVAHPLPDGLQIGLILRTRDGLRVFGMTSKRDGYQPPVETGRHQLRCTFTANQLLPGDYVLGASAFDGDYREQFAKCDPAATIRVAPGPTDGLTTVGAVALNYAWSTASGGNDE